MELYCNTLSFVLRVLFFKKQCLFAKISWHIHLFTLPVKNCISSKSLFCFNLIGDLLCVATLNFKFGGYFQNRQGLSIHLCTTKWSLMLLTVKMKFRALEKQKQTVSQMKNLEQIRFSVKIFKTCQILNQDFQDFHSVL